MVTFILKNSCYLDILFIIDISVRQPNISWLDSYYTTIFTTDLLFTIIDLDLLVSNDSELRCNFFLIFLAMLLQLIILQINRLIPEHASLFLHIYFFIELFILLFNRYADLLTSYYSVPINHYIHSGNIIHYILFVLHLILVRVYFVVPNLWIDCP